MSPHSNFRYINRHKEYSTVDTLERQQMHVQYRLSFNCYGHRPHVIGFLPYTSSPAQVHVLAQHH